MLTVSLFSFFKYNTNWNEKRICVCVDQIKEKVNFFFKGGSRSTTSYALLSQDGIMGAAVAVDTRHHVTFQLLKDPISHICFSPSFIFPGLPF